MLMGVPTTFVVRTINFLDESSVSELTVTKQAFTAPIVMIEGPASREVVSAQTLRLRGDVVLSSCVTEVDKSVEFQWSLVAVVPNDLDEALALDPVTQVTRSLYIGPSQLVPGHNYTFKLTGRMKANQTNVGSEQVQLVCRYAALVAKLDGSDRMVKLGDMLTLNASSSLDSDGILPPGVPVYKTDYAWECFTATGRACLGPESTALLVNKAVLDFDTLQLAPGEYRFQVMLFKEPGPRVASASVKIWISLNSVPQVAINSEKPETLTLNPKP